MKRRENVELVLSPPEVADLARTIPYLVDEVRQELARGDGRGDREVSIDLSAVPPMPATSPLLLLFRLVRRLLGRDDRVVVTGVAPALSAGLVAHLPSGVTLVDQRGRRWTGSVPTRSNRGSAPAPRGRRRR